MSKCRAERIFVINTLYFQIFLYILTSNTFYSISSSRNVMATVQFVTCLECKQQTLSLGTCSDLTWQKWKPQVDHLPGPEMCLLVFWTIWQPALISIVWFVGIRRLISLIPLSNVGLWTHVFLLSTWNEVFETLCCPVTPYCFWKIIILHFPSALPFNCAVGVCI